MAYLQLRQERQEKAEKQDIITSKIKSEILTCKTYSTVCYFDPRIKAVDANGLEIQTQ